MLSPFRFVSLPPWQAYKRCLFLFKFLCDFFGEGAGGGFLFPKKTPSRNPKIKSKLERSVADLPAHLEHGSLGQGGGALGAVHEHVLKVGLVGADLLVALLDGLEGRDDAVGDGILELAVAPSYSAVISSIVMPERADRMLIRLDTPGLFSGSKRTELSQSVTARRILRRMTSGLSRMAM